MPHLPLLKQAVEPFVELVLDQVARGGLCKQRHDLLPCSRVDARLAQRAADGNLQRLVLHALGQAGDELADAGASVLLYTSELKEIQLACDRAIVIFGGRVVAEIAAADADEPALLRAAYNLRSDAQMPEAIAAEVVAAESGAAPMPAPASEPARPEGDR